MVDFKLIALKEASGLCGISPARLRRWIYEDGVPLHHFPDGFRLRRVDLLKCLIRHGRTIPSSLTPSSKVLLVEDDPDMLLVMVDALECLSGKINIATAADGRKGFKKFMDFRPDLIVTDIQMPGLSGIELCRWICQNKEIFPVKILATTGHSGGRGRESALESGADEYLLKPFSPEQLREAVLRLLGEGGGPEGKSK